MASVVLDGLTNLYNRRYMEQRLDKELSYARRFHHPLSFFMVDIDWFKKLNDTYGHQSGDYVLRVEVNIEGDFNPPWWDVGRSLPDAYPTRDYGFGKQHVGQPSVV